MRLQVVYDNEAEAIWSRRVREAAKHAGIDLCSSNGTEGRVPVLAIFGGSDAVTITRLLQSASSCAGDDGTFVLRTDSCPLDAFELIARGATDVIESQQRGATDPAEPISVIASLFARIARWWAVETLATSELIGQRLIGVSPSWHSLVRRVVEVSAFSDASVLVTGQTGTGKELIAQLVHDLDRRPGKQHFALLDCTTIVSTLSGIELFGHERGAFTGADRARPGAIAQADGGTLFLDEVGELPLALQAEFLRVLQEGTYKPVGGSQWKQARFRLVSATNRSLSEASREGSFRTDLFYRLAAVEISLPPLAERADDIPLLARHFLRTLFPKGGPEPDVHVDRFLMERTYRGNVRELRQLVTNMAVRYAGRGPLTLGALPPSERDSLRARARGDIGPCEAGPGHVDVNASLARAVGQAIDSGMQISELRGLVTDYAQEAALTKVGGNVTKAAQTLGLSRRALQASRSGVKVAP